MLGSYLVNPPLCFGLVFLRAILGNVAFLTTTVACLVSMLVALLSKAGLSTIPISRVVAIIITTATPGSLILVFAMAILARLTGIN
jgi:hypothetical protein